ncbi:MULTISPECIES: GNAT family N-acetyltransferase [unclassified Micromonospora]|uniref:GNAT family N-acetyltransferase n=1 Tax=unclassified Micromonospora TaxID=2617518 RepID=UPI001B368FDF|nr:MULTISPECIES: GNAT family N-acetyltransferase [unclassified Micromonospora]MBQ1042706.1 GNAT family N-acetyltransferase [Micromonospora sp. C72]MBQ1054148.1 GNAT family N-acetyltransferase [Micromonospora sp. C32]
MTLTVAPLDPADRQTLDAVYRIACAAQAADEPDLPVPCRRRFEAPLSYPMPGIESRWLVARLDGTPVGWLQLYLHTIDNTENASVELTVDPAYRRRGIGRTLHEHGVRLLREHGGKRLVGATVAALPGEEDQGFPGAAFAAAVGAKPALADVRRRLDVAGLDRDRLAALLAGARAAATGYRPVRWRDHTPEEYVADVAYLDGRLLLDAPMGELDWEPEQVDAARVRDAERALDARGVRRYNTGVVHEATGRLVGWTQLSMDASSTDHAWQQITLVDPDHRGHRLGLLCKAGNLEYALAHEPALRAVDTWNAVANRHMVAINDQLGYRPAAGSVDWQLTI